MTDALVPGVVTPLVALADSVHGVDVEAMHALVDQQLAGGTAAIVVNGSMGELGSLTIELQCALIETVVNAVDGRAPVWAGVAGLGADDAVANAERIAEYPIDTLLALAPFYFEWGTDELRRHFAGIAAVSDLPVIAYDVPPRSRPKLAPELITSLAVDGTIAGVKDSSDSLNSVRGIVTANPDLPVWLGTESAIDMAGPLGAAGSVPGLANIAPALAATADEAGRQFDREAAAVAQRSFSRLFAILGVAEPGAGRMATVINAVKVATCRAIGVPLRGTIRPIPPPSASFVDAIYTIVDPVLELEHDALTARGPT